MAKNDNTPKNPLSKIGESIKEETKRGVFSIMLFVLGIFVALAPFGKAGLVGEKFYALFRFLMGIGYFSIPILSIALGIILLKDGRPRIALPASVGITLFLISGLGIIEIVAGGDTGGIIGKAVQVPMVKLFDTTISILFLSALFAVSLMLIFDTRPRIAHFSFLRSWFAFFKPKPKETAIVNGMESVRAESKDEETANPEHIESVPEAEKAPTQRDETESLKKGGRKGASVPAKQEPELMEKGILRQMTAEGRPFVPPPLSLLEGDRGKPGVGDIKANINIIKRTLKNFGIDVEMDEVSVGPSVTRYALKPAEGVKISRIVGLQNDLSLALAAHPLRIDAPIPGKSLVGIEVPNTTRTTVGLRTLFSSDEFQKSPKALLLAIGRDIAGKLHFADLAKMPHLLIAGTTGSGKSVTIHTIINSILFRNSPQNVRFIMVDPKRVELTLYNNIPHLLTPVITDAKKTIMALRWVAKEMERRYDILETESVRDIQSYHKNVLEPALAKAREGKGGDSDEAALPEHMPYLVIIVDELADIMATYPRELEAAIVRLAQMSRAVGIHLILSTQRPSVNVITGLIKANIPARIALQVASQVDSRTILDTGGAEKLLGAGDMLYLSGEMSKPVRLQSAFISENEVKQVTKYFTQEYQDVERSDVDFTAEKSQGALFSGSFDESDDDDEMYEEARAVIMETGKASSSYLQRRLKVGYARAARLLDMLEERGVVGPADGSKPREIFGRNGPTKTPDEE